MSASTSRYGNPSGRASVTRPGGSYDRPPAPPYGPRKKKLKPRWGRIALLAGIALLVVGVIAGISAYGYARDLDGDMKRADAFAGMAGRPAKAVEGALNLLLVGSDSRDPDTKDDAANEWRADTLMLMHVPADHKSAQLVSIPRDLWVVVPRSNAADCGDGNRAKINASFAFGGLPRAVHTVECLTGVKVDHVVAIDFGGFKQVTDAIGGVDLKVDQSITSIHRPHRKFVKGMMHMNGDQALDWVRQRYQFPRGDFARMQHQQEFLKAIMDKAASSGTLTNPSKLNAFLRAVTAAVTVDNDFSLTDAALQFKSIRSSDLTFITSPNKGSGMAGNQSVVLSDKEKAVALYDAVKNDRMAQWMAANLNKPTGN